MAPAIAPSWFELLVQLAQVTGLFVAVVLPATWLTLRCLPDNSLIARFGVGIALGFALFVIGTWLIGLWSLKGVGVFWLAQCVVAAWLERRAANRRQAVEAQSSGQRAECRTIVPPLRKEGLGGVGFSPCYVWTAASLLAATALHLYALHPSELPLGVDSRFHCVVGLRVLDSDRAIGTLWPLEDLQLNYPIGSHLWLAVAARWTGLEIHHVFRHSFVLALWGSGLLVAAWAERLFGSRNHAGAAAFCFVFGSYQASLYPYTWGGLPSALAMWLALAALYCVVAAEGWPSLLAGMVLLGGSALTHHHTMVAVFGGMLAAALFVWIGGAERLLRRRVVIGLAGGALAAALYIAPLLGRISEVGDTGILSYCEEKDEPHPPWAHLFSWGPGLLLTGALGLTVPVTTCSRTTRRFLLALMGVWLASFAILYYGARWLTEWLIGTPSTPFTPSRFLFDAQHLLAIFAAGGLMRLLTWIGHLLAILADGGWVRLLTRAACVGLLAAMAAWALWQTHVRWQPVPSDILIPMGRWTRTNLPKDALILSGPGAQSQSPWVTYVCRRESTSLFVPISEPKTKRRQLKEALIQHTQTANWDA